MRILYCDIDSLRPDHLGCYGYTRATTPTIDHHAREENWFLHINYWDPHTPYRTPMSFGNPFADDPIPSWVTEDVWRRCLAGYGPHSAREPNGSGFSDADPPFERHPAALD